MVKAVNVEVNGLEVVTTSEPNPSKLLHTLMDTVSEGVFIMNVESDEMITITGMNRLMLRMLPEGAACGVVDDVLPNKLVHWLKRRVRKVVNSGEVMSFRVATDYFNGGRQHVRVRLSPVSEGDTIIQVMGTVSVLTETVKIKKQAEDHRNRFAMAMEYAPYGLCFAGVDGKPLMVNRMLAHWLDKSLSCLMDIPVSEFIHEEDRAMFAQALRKVAQGGRTYRQIEVRTAPTTHATENVWVSVNMSLVQEDSQNSYVIVQMTDITARKMHEAELTRLATQDHLTGLSNRKVFEDGLALALKNARRYNRHGAVLYIDLNNFKLVNDEFGHKAGDAILQQVGTVLHGVMRDTDIVSRIGGDEFAVIMHEASEERARRKSLQIENALAHATVEAHGKTVRCGASVGVHMFDGSDLTSNMDAVIAAADKDMYNNKAASKARLRVVS